MSSSQSLRSDDGARPGPLPHNNKLTQDSTSTGTLPCPGCPCAQQSKLQNNNDLNPGTINEYTEEDGLYDLAEELRTRDPPVEPWFLESSRLRRMYILWLNKQLAVCRKDILESEKPSDKHMETLGKVLHLQGMLPAMRCIDSC
jgi:hypothetical protein